MLEKSRRLTRKSVFNFMYKKGERVNASHLSIVYAPSKNAFGRFGFVVSNKVGKATKRNKVKRRMRAIVRENIKNIDNRYNFIIVARDNIADITYSSLKAEIIYALKKSGHYCEKKN